MKIIEDTFQALDFGPAQIYKNLAITPIQSPVTAEMDYLTLDEALDKKVVAITEVSAEGSVPFLNFINHSGQAVLLLDGEELVGAKQNRILNLQYLYLLQGLSG